MANLLSIVICFFCWIELRELAEGLMAKVFFLGSIRELLPAKHCDIQDDALSPGCNPIYVVGLSGTEEPNLSIALSLAEMSSIILATDGHRYWQCYYRWNGSPLIWASSVLSLFRQIYPSPKLKAIIDEAISSWIKQEEI